MKVFIVAHHTRSLLNFRTQLLASFVKEGHEVIVCSPDNDPEFLEKFSEMGISFITFPLERNGMNPLKDIYSLLFLVRTLKKIKPDVVYSASTKPVIYGSLAARLVGIPRVFSMISGAGYAFIEVGFMRKLINLLVRGLFHMSLKKNISVFFLNPDDRGLFVGLGLLSQKQAIVINGEGVDLKHFHSTPVPTSVPVFLLICRLIKEKGVIVYAEAARILKQKYPEVSFNLLGPFDCNNTSALSKSQIEKWHQEGGINYCGETKDVRPFISAASVFVLPSFYREGLPRSTMEAMSMGRPIITTDWTGCRETVVEGENGFLIPIKNVDALVKAMERFIVNTDLIKKMGQCSRDLAVEKFDVNKVNDKIMKEMGLVGEKPPM
jgi:glycosyltransferase involved in cell wall biosynthesis